MKTIDEIETIVKRELGNFQESLSGSIDKRLSTIRRDIRNSQCRPLKMLLIGIVIGAGMILLSLYAVYASTSETNQSQTLQQEQ